MPLTPQELAPYLRRIRDRVAAEGPKRAAYGMARAFHREVSDATLVRTSHARGTITPSAPGEPPAIISGGLKRSLRLYPAEPAGALRARSHVSPLVIYARIQERGGVVEARHTFTDRYGHVRPGYLKFSYGGSTHFARRVVLPARPYMRPTRDQMVSDGRLRRAAIESQRGLLHG